MRTRAQYAKQDTVTLIDGVPIEEVGMMIEVGDCTVCGISPELATAGALDNVRVEKGIIRGDAICGPCLALRGDGDPEMMDFILRND
jgi:hypothetical protein